MPCACSTDETSRVALVGVLVHEDDAKLGKTATFMLFPPMSFVNFGKPPSQPLLADALLNPGVDQRGDFLPLPVPETPSWSVHASFGWDSPSGPYKRSAEVRLGLL